MSFKRKLAFEWSCERLGESLPHLFLWTFTFATWLPVDEACARWDSLLTVLRRQFPDEWQGIRTFEMHPGGHGLHIHVVIDRFVRVEPVRHLSQACGFGRIDVQAIPVDRASYIGKYLAKERPLALKNKRLFAPFGPRAQKVAVRMCNIVRESLESSCWAVAKAIWPQWASLVFWRKIYIVKMMYKNAIRAHCGEPPLQMPATF